MPLPVSLKFVRMRLKVAERLAPICASWLLCLTEFCWTTESCHPIPRRALHSGPFVSEKMATLSTPIDFMLRELGVQRLGDSFDFSTAAVDLVPTVPTPTDATL